MKPLGSLFAIISIVFVLVSCSQPAPRAQGATSSETGSAPAIEPQVPSSTPHGTVDPDPTPTLNISLTVSPATNAPTYTLASSPTSMPPEPTATEAPPCYQAAFIQDVTYSDGSKVIPGEIFLKIWRFRNEGSCPWDHSFQLDFVGGERFSGPDQVGITFYAIDANLEPQLGNRDWNVARLYTVEPGETVDIALLLRAPLEEGRWRGYWRVVQGGEEIAVIQFYVDVEVAFTQEAEQGVWSGEWEHESQWSDRSPNPLVLRQEDRQVDGFYYTSDGELFLIEANLSPDQNRMEGSFGQVWQAGWPFVLELYPNQNVFNGFYNDSDFTGGAWCGSRSGYAVPLGECLLVD